MKNIILKSLFVFALLASCVFVACKKEAITTTTEEVSYDAYNNDEGTQARTFSGTCPCDNCVLFVRCKMPSLPGGLTSYASKKNIVNAWSPSAGYAVIMPSSSYPANGHIAYVDKVNSDGTITISEGNFNGKCNTRTKKPSDMSVYGYRKP